jgi:hypothetical protein
MENNKGKEISTVPSPDQIESRNNNIQRPQKIQRIDIPCFTFGSNQEPGSTSHGGQANNQGFYTPPAKDFQRYNQESNNQEHEDSPISAEGPFFMYDEEVLGEGIKQCTNSIIGKLLTSKLISKQVLYSSLMGIWCNPAGFKITELENNLYQLSFEKESDINRILKGEPWIIRNVWLKMHLWNMNTNIQELDFMHAPLWIQVWGLPLHCKTVAMGYQLGAQIGQVEESAIYEYPNNAKIIKVKVEFNITNPILAGMYIGNINDDMNWVDFRYENLPLFCFQCGLIGHSFDNCEDDSKKLPEGAVNPRGPWLRSNIYGKRVHEKKEHQFHSNPMKSVSGKMYSPIPKAMMDMMADLRIRRDQANQGKKEETPTGSSSMQGRNLQTKQTQNHLKRKSLPEIQTSQIQHTDSQEIRLASLENKAGQAL